MSGLFNANDPSQNVRPGLYLRFVQAAELQVVSTRAGVVGIPLVSYAGGTAVAEKMYEVKDVAEAEALFGAANVQAIKFALEDAEKVLVFTLPTIDGVTVTEEAAYDKARVAFDVAKFDAFVYDGMVSATEQDRLLRWVQKSVEEGRHFTAVLGCVTATDDDTPATGNARSALVEHDNIVNLINGAVIGGITFTSAEFAPKIAGLIGATPANKSITFKELAVEDVNKRLNYTETKDALKAGSLVLTNTGTKIRIEQGLVTTVSKLRKSLIRQRVSRDLAQLIEDNVIGQYTNNKDTQSFVTSMCKAYLEVLQDDNVLTDIKVEMSPRFESKGDQMFIDVYFTEMDSVEKVNLTIAV